MRGVSSHSAFATGLFPGEKFTSYRDNLALPSCSIGFPHMRCLQPAEGSIKWMGSWCGKNGAVSPNTGLRHEALSAKAGFQSRELIPPSLSGVYWTGRSPQRRALVEAQARESLFGDALNFPFPELADGLGLTDLGESFRGPLHSDVPVLFISGTLDGRTPPANARALLPGFSKGRQLLVRGASHDNELWLGNAGIAGSIADFLAGRPVNDDVLDVPLPVFITSKSEL